MGQEEPFPARWLSALLLAVHADDRGIDIGEVLRHTRPMRAKSLSSSSISQTASAGL
jgi:hypothetical protein